MSNSGKIYWFGTYIYTAFGNQIESTDTENPFRYCGEYYDSETGLTYLRNRYYNSASGRFINEEPIKDGQNWYVYCNSNPVMNVDPSGMEVLIDRNNTEEYKKEYGTEYIDDVKMYFNELSDDEIDNLGYNLYIAERKSTKKVLSSTLTRSLMNNDVDVVVKYQKDTNSAGSVQTRDDGSKFIVVKFDPHTHYTDDKGNYILNKNNELEFETNPNPVIVLAHELNHALSKINGEEFNQLSDNYTYITETGNDNFAIRQKVSIIEVMNIGLSYYNKDGILIHQNPFRITENAIRKELGEGMRLSTTAWRKR